jgi:hypothetical protein
MPSSSTRPRQLLISRDISARLKQAYCVADGVLGMSSRFFSSAREEAGLSAKLGRRASGSKVVLEGDWDAFVVARSTLKDGLGVRALAPVPPTSPQAPEHVQDTKATQAQVANPSPVFPGEEWIEQQSSTQTSSVLSPDLQIAC